MSVYFCDVCGDGKDGDYDPPNEVPGHDSVCDNCLEQLLCIDCCEIAELDKNDRCKSCHSEWLDAARCDHAEREMEHRRERQQEEKEDAKLRK